MKLMENLAVIKTGGKQYCVTNNSRIDIEIFKDCKEGEKVSFDKVLLFDDGEKTNVGAPYIDNKTVEGIIEQVGRKKKISVIKFRSKSDYKKHYGHRQPFCRVQNNICLDNAISTFYCVINCTLGLDIQALIHLINLDQVWLSLYLSNSVFNFSARKDIV